MSKRKPVSERIKVFDKNPPPVAGTFFIVPKDTWLDSISYKVYGYDRTPDIISSNAFLKSRPIGVANLPYIHPGDRLWLPPKAPLESDEPETITADNDDEISIRIDGKVFTGWAVSSVERLLNGITDGFKFTAPFNWEDTDSRFLDPFTFYDVDLFIGGKLYISGRAEGWNPVFSDNSTLTTISCRSKTGQLVDSASMDNSLTYTKQTLEQITKKLIEPFGIKAFFPEGNGGTILKAKRNPQDKIFSFISGLAKKKGFIVNSTKTGNISFDRANIDGTPIMSLVQGQQPLLGVSASYDGQQRFSEFTAISQSRGRSGNKSISIDNSVPIKRLNVFTAKDTEQGNIETASQWERSRSVAKSAPVTVKIGKWYDDFNELITENQIITLYAPNVHIYNETRFLIEKVTLHKEENGHTAVMTLVLPESYTLEFPSSFPWSR